MGGDEVEEEEDDDEDEEDDEEEDAEGIVDAIAVGDPSARPDGGLPVGLTAEVLIAIPPVDMCLRSGGAVLNDEGGGGCMDIDN